MQLGLTYMCLISIKIFSPWLFIICFLKSILLNDWLLHLKHHILSCFLIVEVITYFLMKSEAFFHFFCWSYRDFRFFKSMIICTICLGNSVLRSLMLFLTIFWVVSVATQLTFKYYAVFQSHCLLSLYLFSMRLFR